jgi:hypothetical protein
MPVNRRLIVAIGLICCFGAVGSTPALAQPYSATRTGDIVQLEDRAGATVVSILTSAGNIAYEMRVKGQNILRFPFASVDDLRAKPARVGIPLLAPWGNRLDEQAFYANGRRFPFDMQLGNITGAIPIHGFLSLTDKWQIIELKHDATAAWLTARLDVYKQPTIIHPEVTGDPRNAKHLLQLKDFARAIAEHRQPPVTVRDGRRVLQVIDAVFASARAAAPIAIPA